MRMMQAPSAHAGRGGGGGQATPPCPGQGGGGAGRACRRGGGQLPPAPSGGEVRTPRGYPQGGPCKSAEGGGYGHHPCAFITGRRDVLHPCACQHRVEGLSLQPCACQHRVEGTVGVAPLQPTPAPLPIEGLWECCNRGTRAATHVPLLVHPGYCCSSGSAAALQTPPPPPVPPRGHGGATTAALKLQRTQGQQSQPVSRGSSGTASAPQPSPLHYQSRGHRGAAIAALWRLPTYCSCRSECHAAPVVHTGAA